MGNSFVLFDVSIVISHGQFHRGNRGHTQNTDSPWVKSHFPVGKRSSGTATNIVQFSEPEKGKTHTKAKHYSKCIEKQNTNHLKFSQETCRNWINTQHKHALHRRAEHGLRLRRCWEVKFGFRCVFILLASGWEEKQKLTRQSIIVTNILL